jgi:LacI family transcriptional regulator
VTIRHITSEDVAKHAGVSRTTVSLVLNGVKSIHISPQTRQKVLDSAKSLGYVPNAMAQALVSKRTQAVGLIFTRQPHHIASDAFMPQVLDGMLEVVRANNLRLMIDIIEPEHQEQAYLQLIRAKRIDGIVFSGPRIDDIALTNLEKESFPTVLMGQLPNSRFHSVDVDNRQAARQAVEYLISLGHRQIVCITNAPLSYTASADRLLGYREALVNSGIPYDEALVRSADFDPESGYIQMESLLSSGIKFTAGFIASDTVLIGAKAALREHGLGVPADISLVGFDDIAWAKYMDPPLTTVQLPAHTLGSRACSTLLQILQGFSPQQKDLVLPTKMILRHSCQNL